MNIYKFLTVAGMDYEIDPEDNEPDTLLALNDFTVTEEEYNDKELFKKICSDEMIILGLKRFMDIADYYFKSDSVVSIAEKLKETDTVEADIIEYDKTEVRVGTDLEHSERKRAIIPINTKIRITFKESLLGGYKLNVDQWTNDNDEDQEFGWNPLFWITLLSI
jgi:hypothetical protein